MGDRLDKAKALYDQGRYDKALAELAAELKERPDAPEVHEAMAWACLQTKKNEDALRSAQEAVRLAPERAAGHYVLALALSEAGRPDDALASVIEALGLDPGNPDGCGLKAMLLLKQGDSERALEAAKEGLKRDAQHIQCLRLRVSARWSRYDRSRVPTALRCAMSVGPNDPLNHVWRGWLFTQRGDTARAVESFREALRLNPQLPLARDGILDALKAASPVRRYVFGLIYLILPAPGMSAAGVFFRLGLLAAGAYLLGDASGSSPWLWALLLLAATAPALTFARAMDETLATFLLLLNPAARQVARPEGTASTVVGGIAILAGVAALAASVFTGNVQAFLLGLFLLAMTLPFLTLFSAKGRCGVVARLCCAAIVAACGAVLTWSAPSLERDGIAAHAVAVFVLFFGTIVASMVLINLLISPRYGLFRTKEAQASAGTPPKRNGGEAGGSKAAGGTDEGEGRNGGKA